MFLFDCDSLQSALSTHKQEILNLQKALEDLSLLTKRELEQVSVARQKLEKGNEIIMISFVKNENDFFLKKNLQKLKFFDLK